MTTPKEHVKRLLEILPDDCTLEDFRYHLYVIQKIENGTNDREAGRVYSQDDMEMRMERWLGK
ncbi:MAG: hypothetical protein HZA22_11840 [Nitrospirae bacterium]|nr:hypothetical protein [Nitrospirota bacterium]